MRLKSKGLLGLALVAGMVGVGATRPAHAVPVTYTTLGTFDSGDLAGSSTYLDIANGIDITFENILSQTVDVNPPPVSGISFGNFNTSLTTAATLEGVASGFTIEIFQAAPIPTGPGSLLLVGTLSGTLSATASTASVLFTGFTPAVLPAPFGDAGLIGSFFSPTEVVNYYLTEADGDLLGRANIVPPSVNLGISSVEGAITLTVVPEPSTLALAGLGCVAAGLLATRSRKGAAQA